MIERNAYSWDAIVQLHRERGCAFDGVRYSSHTCANATRSPSRERPETPDYTPTMVPDAPEIEEGTF